MKRLLLVLVLSLVMLIACTSTPQTTAPFPPPEGYTSWEEYEQAQQQDNSDQITTTTFNTASPSITNNETTTSSIPKTSAVDRPDTGTTISGEKAQSDSFEDLTVENGLSVDAVVVVVKESSPNQVIRAVYIRGHDSYILMDLGIDKAEVYFMLGNNWSDQENKFLSDLKYERFEEVFDFSWYTYEITLHGVIGGTADTEYIDEEEFPELP
jgi:hypothetical protein